MNFNQELFPRFQGVIEQLMNVKENSNKVIYLFNCLIIHIEVTATATVNTSMAITTVTMSQTLFPSSAKKY